MLFKSIYEEEVYSVRPQLTVVLSEPWASVTEDQRILLNKILQAVGSSVDGARILHQTSFDISGFKEKPSKVLAFTPAPKGINPYEIIPTQDTSMIFSAPLSELLTDDGAKRKLWGALKSLFQTS